MIKNLIIALLLTVNYANCQEAEAFVKKGFLIILSTKDYDSAYKRAEEASIKLGLKLETNSIYPDEENGLQSDEVCGCGEKHGYIPRGRYDDGDYVSIEYSSRYESFTDGYYIVVIGSGQRKSLKPLLSKAKEHYQDAYVKNSSVYIGCMH